MPWLIVKRLAISIPTIIGVLLVTFVIARLLPSDPAAFFAGPAADNAAIAQMRHSMHLDQPILTQLEVYLVQVMHGDLGNSFLTGQSVTLDIFQRLPASLELAICSLVLAVIVAIPMGILAATRRGSPFDRFFGYGMTISAALPTFFAGLLLLFVFYAVLKWSPAPIGQLPIFASPPPSVTGFLVIDCILAGQWDTLHCAVSQLVLPSVSLALFALAPIARLTRSLMLDVLGSDYIMAARAHGLGTVKIIVVYALRNALTPLLNVLGMIFSFLLGATVLVEKIYGWPGIGSYAVEAVLSADYAAVQGFVLSVATLYILINLCIDLLSMILDPRLRGLA